MPFNALELVASLPELHAEDGPTADDRVCAAFHHVVKHAQGVWSDSHRQSHLAQAALQLLLALEEELREVSLDASEIHLRR